jgi:dTDP-4-amino-4,6-dideoxygalactose transaminase
MRDSRLALSGGKPLVNPALHVRWPVITPEDRAAVLGVLDRGVLSGPFAPEVRGLEREFAQYLGSRHCLATNSGTSALHVSLAALGIGPGDEVITPAFSFVATAMAVLQQNAVPVFVDIEPQTFGLDPAKLEEAITLRTRAIVPVHLHGMPCDLEPILAIARRHDLPVLEDAAQAHGALLEGRKVGTFGSLGCFSLQSSKNLACGEGGLVVTDDPDLLQKASRTRSFGENVRLSDEIGYQLSRPLDGDRAYDSLAMGWMYRMTEMSAALARSQLHRLDSFNENARRNAAALSQALAKLPGVTPPATPPGRTPVFHKFRVSLDARPLGSKAPPKRVRDAVLRALVAEGVDAVLWQTQPVPGQKIFRDRIGFGRVRGRSGPGCPWDHSEPVDYDLARYPETTRLLDRSLCLFSQSYPIAPQPIELAEAYGAAFEKVWVQLDEVLARTATEDGAPTETMLAARPTP